MTAPVTNYTLKDLSNVQVVEFDTSSVEAMEEVRDWLIANLPQDFEVVLQVSMGGMLRWNGPGVMWPSVRPGEFLARAGMGNVFKLTREQLDAFFQPAA